MKQTHPVLGATAAALTTLLVFGAPLGVIATAGALESISLLRHHEEMGVMFAMPTANAAEFPPIELRLDPEPAPEAEEAPEDEPALEPAASGDGAEVLKKADPKAGGEVSKSPPRTAPSVAEEAPKGRKALQVPHAHRQVTVADAERRAFPGRRAGDDGARQATDGSTPKVTPRTRRGSKRDCGGAHDQVRKTGKASWHIDRSLVKYYTASVKRFNSLGYSRAYDEGGHKGWYITGFSCASPVYKGGLRPRDVILSVNGKPTSTALQMFGLWTRWARHSDFDVKVLRRGKVITLRYQID